MFWSRAMSIKRFSVFVCPAGNSFLVCDSDLTCLQNVFWHAMHKRRMTLTPDWIHVRCPKLLKYLGTCRRQNHYHAEVPQSSKTLANLQQHSKLWNESNMISPPPHWIGFLFCLPMHIWFHSCDNSKLITLHFRMNSFEALNHDFLLNNSSVSTEF